MRAFKCDHCGEYRDYGTSARFPEEPVRVRVRWHGSGSLRHVKGEGGGKLDFCSALCASRYFADISGRIDEERVPRFLQGIEALKAAAAVKEGAPG